MVLHSSVCSLLAEIYLLLLVTKSYCLVAMGLSLHTQERYEAI